MAVGYWVFPVTVVYDETGKKDVCPHVPWTAVAAGPVPTQEQVRTWWEQHPGAWPGIITGKNGLVTVDCDVPHTPGEPDGREEWLAATGGLLPEHTLPTSTGGQHHMYRSAVRVRNSVKEVAPGVDVRGEMGAQFVHPCAWEAAVCLPAVTELDPLPQVVLDFETARDARQAPASGGSSASVRSPAYAPNSERRFTSQQAMTYIEEKVAALLEGAAPGDTNHRLNSAALLCGHFVPGLLTQEAAETYVSDCAYAARVETGPAPDTSDWGKTIRSGLRRGMEDPYVIDDSPRVPRQRGVGDTYTAPGTAGADPASPATAPVAVDGERESEPRNLPVIPRVLPDAMWRASETLDRLRRDALSRGATPDAVLLAVLCRVSAVVHHKTRVEGDAGPASLNLFGVAVGRSGQGKSTAIKLAAEIVPFPSECPDTSDGSVTPWIDEASLASGQGVSATYYGTREDLVTDSNGKTKTVKSVGWLRHNAMFVLDEGAVASANTTTEGSILKQVLCAAWQAERNGQANASSERRRSLPADSYAMGLYMGMQPGLMGPFLNDTTSGLAQRMLFAWAEPDPTALDSARAVRAERIKARRHGRHHTSLAATPKGLAAAVAGTYVVGTATGLPRNTGQTIMLSEELALELADEAIDYQFGRKYRPAHRTHDGLKRLKVSALLALLHHLRDVEAPLDGKDGLSAWDVAGLIVETSDAVRTHCLELDAREAATRRAQKAEADRDRGKAAREGQIEADEAADLKRTSRLHGVAVRIVAHLDTRCEGKRDSAARARKALSIRCSGDWDAALSYAVDHEWVATQPGRQAGSVVLTLGPERPGASPAVEKPTPGVVD